MKQRLSRLLQNSSAVTAIEYSLLASLIAAIVIIGATTFGDSMTQLYVYVRDQIVLALQ
jgi:pilus assembly protein Flp/PilA